MFGCLILLESHYAGAQMTPRIRRLAIAFATLIWPTLLLAAVPSMQPQGGPDFTKGQRIPEGASHDWALGATGARGWMHTEKMVTSVARQIAITAVAKDSPAAKLLMVGDVILGIGDQPFQTDPRTELGRALTLAESKEGRGRLALRRWRSGKTKVITLKLPVLGTYSPTAPYDCPKSQRILKQGCKALAARMQEPSYKPNPIPRCLNALALLASGERKYRKLVAEEAKWASNFSTGSFQTWYYGYVCMLLSEYIMITGDQSVLPGLTRLALEAANGQSKVGSWGHRFAEPTGRLAGYGMMNAPGATLTISLVLAQMAGVSDPKVAKAVERSTALLRFYIGKGAIPYGDHHPWIQTHEDNGKCGMGAVLFDLLGEKQGASFFARMSLASHGAERDTGHTGNFFNICWSLPAISRLGKVATGAWMQEFGAWYFDLARQPDGSFCHLGPPQERNDKYAKWDATGAYLLAYALPLKKLVLTGKQPSTSPTMDANSAASLLADGQGWSNRDRTSFYAKLDQDELLQRLRSWSPIVRERAAIALARIKASPVSKLIKMLSDRSLDARYGACQALAKLRGKAGPAVSALEKSLRHRDLWLRVKAADALSQIGAAAMPALPSLLTALAKAPRTSDPRGMEQRYLCFALFDSRNGMLRRSLDNVDRKALYTAIRAGLKNEDGRARSAVSSIYEKLSFQTLEPLLPAIYEATMEPSPSGIMFADGVRMAGLKLMAKHSIQEGVGACVHYVRHQKKHGSQKRVPQVLEILSSYGAHAQSGIPELLKTAEYFETAEQNFPKKLSKQKAAAVREAVAQIRASKDRPKLIRIR